MKSENLRIFKISGVWQIPQTTTKAGTSVDFQHDVTHQVKMSYTDAALTNHMEQKHHIFVKTTF